MVRKEFALPSHRMKQFTAGIVAIAVSKFKAVNNCDKNFTDRKLKARIEQLEDGIKRATSSISTDRTGRSRLLRRLRDPGE